MGGGPLTLNTAPITGNLRLCIVNVGCNNFLDVPLTVSGTQGLGLGGTVAVNGFGKGTHLSVIGAPWTVADATVTGIYTTNAMILNNFRVPSSVVVHGFVHGPVSGTSSTARTGAVIQLVAPNRIATNLSGYLQGFPAFSTLTVHILTPEPGTFVLLGLGLALLGAGRRRHSKH